MTLAVLAYLNRVNGEPGIDQKGLAARLGIDRASTCQLVDKLEAKGLIDRRVNGADRRGRLLRLTPRGERLRVRLLPVQRAKQMQVLASLSPTERELLFDLLIRVIESNSALARPGTGRRKRRPRKLVSNQARKFMRSAKLVTISFVALVAIAAQSHVPPLRPTRYVPSPSLFPSLQAAAPTASRAFWPIT
jgi:DNA-binding MarR family transcriptional regulator